jgi:hypothetical protein
MIGRLPFFVDIDDTLIMHDLSEHAEQQKITITVDGREFTGAVNQPNINLVIKFWKLGRDVYFWSGTGPKHARAVADALNLTQYAANEHAFLPKPIDYYLDDKDAAKWAGKRVWRNPKTGREE